MTSLMLATSRKNRLIKKIRSLDPLLFYILQEGTGALTTPSYGSVLTPLTYSGPTLGQSGPFPGWVAPSFDNTDDRAADVVAVSPTTASLMVVYYKTATNAAVHGIAGVGNQSSISGLAGILLATLATHVLEANWTVGAGVGVVIDSAVAPAADRWHIATTTYDLANLQLYNNALAETPVAETRAIDWTTTNLVGAIGSIADFISYVFPWGGRIALMALFPRAISRSDHDEVARILRI